MEYDSNNKKEKNNKITSTHKNKNTLWKSTSIFAKTIAKTIDNIKNGLEKLTINDLLKLFGNKKQYSFFSFLDKNNERKNKIGFTTGTLRINYNAIEFFKNLYQILDKELSTNNIVVNTLDNNSNQRFFVINPNSEIDYFEIPLSIEGQECFRLVFRASNFYLQGFVWLL